MTALPGHRAGMAIINLEAERAMPDRIVIRVRTIDELASADGPEQQRTFGDLPAAIGYLGEWLEQWRAGVEGAGT